MEMGLQLPVAMEMVYRTERLVHRRRFHLYRVQVEAELDLVLDIGDKDHRENLGM